MDYLTTGRLAKEAGVKIDTVRYYEKRGLIPKPPRKDSGYRMFKEDTIKRIAFIKHAQEIGFSLHEIEELLFLRVNSKTTCSEVKKRTEAKIAEVESKILHLHRIKKALEKMVTICSANKRIGDCPILDMLDDEGAGFLPGKVSVMQFHRVGPAGTVVLPFHALPAKGEPGPAVVPYTFMRKRRGEIPPPQRGDNMKKENASSLGTIITALLAASCCIGPAVFAVFGTSVGFLGKLTVPDPVRPYLLTVAFAMFGYSFWKLYLKKTIPCACEADNRSRTIARAIFWFGFAALVFAVSFPKVIVWVMG